MALTLGVNSGFVTVAPTADPAETGETIDGSSVVTKHTSPAGATKITSIGWYRASGTNAANWEIALYADSAGVAGTRLAVDATNSTTSNGWVVTSVNWAISENTAYWLALQMDAHSGASSVDGAAAGGAGSDVMTSQTTLADPYGGGAVADSDGMYAIYALVNITHPTSGTLTGPGSTVAGTAARTAAPVSHATSGALTGQGSTIVGSAARFRAHATTGAVIGPGSTVTGSAARFRAFATSGVLTGAGSTIAGSADRQDGAGAVTHATEGVLTGAGSIIEGAAILGAVPVIEIPAGGGGGLGWVSTEKRKPWKSPDDVRQYLLNAYAKLTEAPASIARPAVAAVREYVKPQAPKRTIPKSREIDWRALMADLQAVEALAIAYHDLLMKLEDEEEDDMLLLMAA